ncbi:hypothetical protein ACE3KB_06160 [Enterobacter hormaechei subsp. oharae]
MTLTKEWLLKTIAELEEERDATPGAVNEDAAMALVAMKLAMASLEAEPVAYMYKDNLHSDARFSLHTRFGNWSQEDINEYEITEIPLYAAPPAAVSVPEWTNEQCLEFLSIAFRHAEIKGDLELDDIRLGVKMVNGSRAAMLQGAEHVTTAYKLPMQPLVIDAHGRLRFKENPIVRTLLDYATEHGYGLNEIAREEFDAEDQMQLAQLIGYSLSGYGTLSYVTDESYERAAAAAPQQEAE